MAAARDEVERMFAQSLVRPLNPDAEPRHREGMFDPAPPKLTLPEVEALGELARLRDGPLGIRFLDEATRDPIALVQIRSRSEPALIAAIGLAPRKRERAARLGQPSY